MSIVDQFGRPIQTGSSRNHAAAQRTRFTSDWLTTDSPLDRYLTRDLVELQNRSTALEMDDGYARRFFQEVESNVVGERGIQFTPLCRKADGRIKSARPAIDTAACEVVAQAWEEFSGKSHFTASRRFSRRRFEQLAVRQVARLGGLLVRMVKGFDNPFGFAVHPISIRNLSPKLNDEQRGIHMGIEFDEWDRVTAYHVTKRRNRAKQSRSYETERLPADSVIHLFMSDDFDQSQGKPWLTASMLRLRMLGKYEEAETIAAIESANNTTYFQQNEFAEYTGDEDEDGNIREKSQPGQKTILPKGMTAQQVQPMHPNTVYPDFRKAVLRGVASSIIVSYNVLANDLEGVSFSSIRQGVISERDLWKIVQCWFIDDCSVPVFKNWLEQSLLMGKLGSYGISDFSRLANGDFSGRRWAWVDPTKDIAALEREIALSINSRSKAAKDTGKGDFESIAEQNEQDTKSLISKGLALPLVAEKPASGAK
jgi:lambda family phage portal protein